MTCRRARSYESAAFGKPQDHLVAEHHAVARARAWASAGSRMAQTAPAAGGNDDELHRGLVIERRKGLERARAHRILKALATDYSRAWPAG